MILRLSPWVAARLPCARYPRASTPLVVPLPRRCPQTRPRRLKADDDVHDGDSWQRASESPAARRRATPMMMRRSDLRRLDASSAHAHRRADGLARAATPGARARARPDTVRSSRHRRVAHVKLTNLRLWRCPSRSGRLRARALSHDRRTHIPACKILSPARRQTRQPPVPRGQARYRPWPPQAVDRRPAEVRFTSIT
jgi:hypothetical protein